MVIAARFVGGKFNFSVFLNPYEKPVSTGFSI